MFDRWKLLKYSLQFLLGIKVLAVIKIAISGKNNFWFDLAETVQYAFYAKIR